MTSPERANWLGVPAFYNLNCAATMLVQAFGPHVFLVGSCMERRDYRDVDVRVMMEPERFERMFPGLHGHAYQTHATWNLICVAVSEWLTARTGLPIDFQIQHMDEANERFPSPDRKRCAIGLFVSEDYR